MLVTRPEPSAFREAARTSRELQSLGIKNQHLIINGIFTSQTPSDSIATAMQQRSDAAIESLPDDLRDLSVTTLPLAPAGLMGVDALRQLALEPSGTAAASCPRPPDQGLPRR